MIVHSRQWLKWNTVPLEYKLNSSKHTVNCKIKVNLIKCKGSATRHNRYNQTDKGENSAMY